MLKYCIDSWFFRLDFKLLDFQFSTFYEAKIDSEIIIRLMWDLRFVDPISNLIYHPTSQEERMTSWLSLLNKHFQVLGDILKWKARKLRIAQTPQLNDELSPTVIHKIYDNVLSEFLVLGILISPSCLKLTNKKWRKKKFRVGNVSWGEWEISSSFMSLESWAAPFSLISSHNQISVELRGDGGDINTRVLVKVKQRVVENVMKLFYQQQTKKFTFSECWSFLLMSSRKKTIVEMMEQKIGGN